VRLRGWETFLWQFVSIPSLAVWAVAPSCWHHISLMLITFSCALFVFRIRNRLSNRSIKLSTERTSNRNDRITKNRLTAKQRWATFLCSIATETRPTWLLAGERGTIRGATSYKLPCVLFPPSYIHICVHSPNAQIDLPIYNAPTHPSRRQQYL